MNSVFSNKGIPAKLGKSVQLMGIAFVCLACCNACYSVATRGLGVGTDTRAYAHYFKNMREFGVEGSRIEPGYALIVKIVSVLGFDIQGMQAINFLLLLLTVLYATKEYWKTLHSDEPYLILLSISLIMFFFVTNICR